jgi:hypothetical protein
MGFQEELKGWSSGCSLYSSSCECFALCEDIAELMTARSCVCESAVGDFGEVESAIVPEEKAGPSEIFLASSSTGVGSTRCLASEYLREESAATARPASNAAAEKKGMQGWAYEHNWKGRKSYERSAPLAAKISWAIRAILFCSLSLFVCSLSSKSCAASTLLREDLMASTRAMR